MWKICRSERLMNSRDIKLISENRLTNRSVLQRVLNAAGVPYSIILVNGNEIMSTETSREPQMMEYFRELRTMEPERW